MLRLIRRIFLPGLLAFLLATALGWQWVEQVVNKPINAPEAGAVLRVDPGSNVTRIARELVARQLIRREEPFILYARLKDKTDIKTGEYQLSAEDTQSSLLDRLISGDVIVYQVTFPEGLTLEQWLSVAADHPKLAASAADISLAQLKKELGLNHLEGWFFPDTYYFTAEEDISDILLQAHSRMKTLLDQEWQQRDKGLPYQSPYEALIMASIVERETGLASERSQIAGVFVRRLQKGMRLQTDPTVIYGMGAGFDGNIRRKDLRADNPYNTYTRKGLPPTPIAMPGRQTLIAAANPSDGTALYFVADGKGGHTFSATLEEHEAAVKELIERK